jgi:hypothetical protein
VIFALAAAAVAVLGLALTLGLAVLASRTDNQADRWRRAGRW